MHPKTFYAGLAYGELPGLAGTEAPIFDFSVLDPGYPEVWFYGAVVDARLDNTESAIQKFKRNRRVSAECDRIFDRTGHRRLTEVFGWMCLLPPQKERMRSPSFSSGSTAQPIVVRWWHRLNWRYCDCNSY